jgi:general stress protein 26
MTRDEAVRKALELMHASSTAYLGTNGPDGCPWIKAMLLMEHEGLARVWFGTNTSSKRIAHLRADPRASVYAADPPAFRGILLLGTAEALEDRESKNRLWREGFERYYPLGVEDPDYSVIRFTARSGNYYENLENVSFDIP